MTDVIIYDESQNVVAHQHYTYGKEGELLSVSGQGTPEPASYTYDSMYRVLSLTDARGNITNSKYDGDGNVTEVDRANGTDKTTFTYDNLGRGLSRVDNRGLTTSYTYQGSTGQLTKITYPTSLPQYPSGPSAIHQVTYSYDIYGRVQSVTGPWENRTYTYNLADALTEVDTQSAAPLKSLLYAYYRDGSRATMTIPTALGGATNQFSYQYDNAGRMTTLINPWNERTQYGYQDNNWLSSQSVYNGVLANSPNIYGSAMSYNTLGQRSTLFYNNPAGQTLSVFDGGYANNASQPMLHNGLGDIVGPVREGTLFAPPAFSRITSYVYDPNTNRLTGEQINRSGTFSSDSYGYDSAGNLAQYTSNVQPSYNRSAISYNTADQPQISGWTYDATGSQSAGGLVGSALYDYENHQTTIQQGSFTEESGYREDGLRTWEYDSAHPARYFVYDGATPVIETDVTGNILAVNTFGPNGLVSRRTSAGSRFYCFDELGNTALRLDSTGTMQASSFTEAYGVTATLSSNYGASDWDPFDGFGAQYGYYHDPSQLYLCGERFYDPSQGRWLTRDPIGQSGGIDLYSYCEGNPIMGADPSGLFEIGGMIFDDDTVGTGLSTGLAATASAFSFGLWDGGACKNEAGFSTSVGLASVGRDLLIAAATMGGGAAEESEAELAWSRKVEYVEDLDSMGETDKFGNIAIKDGMSPQDTLETLKHELVHSFFSPEEGSFLAEQRADFGMSAYKNSQLMRWMEETMAESFGTGNIGRGLTFAVGNAAGYGLTWQGIAGEAAIVGAGATAAIYAGRQLTK